MNDAFVTLSVFVLGAISVCLSAYVCVRFYLIHKKTQGKARVLSKGFGLQLVGEFVSGVGTMVFTSAAHLGILDFWSVGLQSSIRTVMFGANLLTTLHLLYVLHYIRGDT
jgi:hypothetical protein